MPPLPQIPMPVSSDRPWQFKELLTMEKLGEYLDKTPEAARIWFKRSGLAKSHGVKCGRKWMVDRRDVDRKLEQDARRARR